jgi:hypothetical protein
MTRRGSVAMSVGREAAPRKGKGEDNARWANTKLTVSKNKKKFTWLIQLLQIDGDYLKQP